MVKKKLERGIILSSSLFNELLYFFKWEKGGGTWGGAGQTAGEEDDAGLWGDGSQQDHR